MATFRTTPLKLMRGWSLSEGGRYYYRGKRKSEKSFTRARNRRQKLVDENYRPWTRSEFIRQMSFPQAQVWIERAGEPVDEDGYPDMNSSFSAGYFDAMEEGWSEDAHGSFAEFLDGEVGIRDETDFDIGYYPDRE